MGFKYLTDTFLKQRTRKTDTFGSLEIDCFENV